MAKPFFPWMGNKEKLVPYIHQLIPPHVKQFTAVSYTHLTLPTTERV